MEPTPRRSTREVKLKKDENFIYDNAVLDALSGRKTWQPSNVNQGATNSSVSSEINNINDSCPCGNPGNCKGWSDIELPLVSNLEPTIESAIEKDIILSVISGAVSLSQIPEQSEHPVSSASQSVNVNIGSDKKRVNSSTSAAFLDNLDAEGNPFLSVESSSGMSGDESRPVSNFNNVNMLNEGEECATPTEGQLASAVMATLKKVDSLAEQVQSCKNIMIKQSNLINIQNERINAQNVRLERIEGNSTCGTESESDKAKKTKGNSVNKSKLNRVEFESDRQLQVMLANLEYLKLDKNKKSGASNAVDSDEEYDLTELKKLMPKKDRDRVSQTLQNRLQQAGSVFPEESETDRNGESDDSSDNGKIRRRKSKVRAGETDSSDDNAGRARRRTVRSGRKVKRRPVVRTELWPHTIAIEDDGEEVTSDDISLSKFLSCFTYIMTTCENAEATGRMFFLQAICTVLECLPWSEARSFHNIVMVKLEQGRVDWGTDFAAMASHFLDKKVRLSLRPKAAGPSQGYRSRFRGAGKGYSGRSRPVQVCRQWNEGTCSFGDNCRFKHVCRACANAGNSGERHKASSQSCPNGRKGKSEQRNES